MKIELNKWIYVMIGIKENINAMQIHKKYDITYSHVSQIIKAMTELGMIESKRTVKREVFYVLSPQAYMLAKYFIGVKSIMESNKWN